MNGMKIRQSNELLRWLILGTGVCAACRGNTLLATYPSRALEAKIRAYTDSDEGRADNRKVLTINSFTTGDTVRFEMYNTFPDSTEAKTLGYDTISGFTVFFIGSEQNDYVRVNTTPRQATRRLQGLIIAKYGSCPVPGINYNTCVFQFVNHRLVN